MRIPFFSELAPATNVLIAGMGGGFDVFAGLPLYISLKAQTETGKWIVIECNDAQESGYAGVSPFGLWQRIVDLEKGIATEPNSDGQ